MNATANKITAGQTLTARAIGDWECVFSLTVIDRKGSFATVKFQGKEKRVKVRTEQDGSEYLMPATYSMAPIFRAA